MPARVRFRIQLLLLLLLGFSNPVLATGFSLFLRDGMLYGPGNLGTHKLQDGSLSNFILTAPLSGAVEMFNNRGEAPNILAESLHVTAVDGALSDGTKINENVDVGFVLEIEEPETGELVSLLVCSVSNEKVRPDNKGNIHFSLTAGFDPGLPEFVVKMPVTFVTGVATVPVSEKTRLGESGGLDHAGPYPAGYSKVGKLGDFDNDGMLDGEFILGATAPLELIIAEGDPILVVRPFNSDIPIGAADAFSYGARGVYENYPKLFKEAIKDKQVAWLREYMSDIDGRLLSLENSLKRIRIARRQLSAVGTRGEKGAIKHNLLRAFGRASGLLNDARDELQVENYDNAQQKMGDFFTELRRISAQVDTL